MVTGPIVQLIGLEVVCLRNIGPTLFWPFINEIQHIISGAHMVLYTCLSDICTHTHTDTPTNTRTHLHTHIHTNTHTYIHIHTHTHTHIYIYIGVYIWNFIRHSGKIDRYFTIIKYKKIYVLMIRDKHTPDLRYA